MNIQTAAESVFAPVAQRVQVWVVLRRWLVVLRMTLIPSSLVLVLMVLAALRGSVAVVTPWLGLILWLAGSLAYAWWRRPGAFSALALWDQAAGRREAFASAWWFEQRSEGSDAARMHIAAQREMLSQALPSLRRDLPLKPDRWLAIPLFIAILGSFISIVTAPPSEVVVMDEEMTRKAADEAQKLAQTDWEKKKLAGLKEEETKQVEDLKRKLQQTASDLANAGGKDARDVLAELERRARDAEKLADELGNGKEAWASDKLVEALRQHADTADLGDSVAAKNAKASAKAAEMLANRLKSPQLDADAKERMNEALKDVQQQADKEDRKRTVGQNVLAAGDQMQQGKPAGAGEEFQKLADKMRDLALREQSRNELQQLAQQLRDSGSNIAGQNESNGGAMQQMSPAGQSGPQGQQGSAPQVGQAQSQQQGLNPPGMGQSGQQNQMQQPQSGQGQGQQQQLLTMGQGQQGQPGQQGAPSNGQPMLLAPIPGGAKPDDKTPLLIMPGDQSPSDPQGPILAMPGSGLPPGVGKADLNSAPTQKQNSGNQSVVQGQQNNEGQSTVRSVEGGTRNEQSARTATQATLEAIQAEEAALDEAALPPARREQVRRYFNELRKRFEAK
ncbi:hypothetical protein [Prosthecobacter sp.]|uniref:hypothetical protein n=1 Tax=Prosthecobacter sp. TaxID=1965333 RepID=UPI001D37F7E0|nr:hypothetical protein [Prosthecobacter sp.]MCB1279249.1 hypothetical protein [Prosthecobacter sp.]